MRKFLLSALSFLPVLGMAQTYPGYRTGNYTGVNGVFFNPANIADNRFAWDLNIFAINGFVGNDQSGLRFKDITKSFTGDSLKSKLLRGRSDVNALTYVDVLGPSFMIGLSPRLSVAVTTRTRVFANAKDIDGDLASAVISSTSAFNPGNIQLNNSLVHATGWSELGGSVGYVLTPAGGRNFLKAGITLKYLAGTADSYLYMRGIGGNLDATDPATLTNVTGTLGFNATDADFNHYTIGDIFKFSGHGVGGDIGFVYEYRPARDYSMYESDRFANKYKIKVGLALTDVGRIRFARSSNTSAEYSGTGSGTPIDLSQFNQKSVKEFKSVFDSYTTGIAPPLQATGGNTGAAYTITLPSTLQGDVDWLITDHVGLNFAGSVSLNNPGALKMYFANVYGITPRWENKLFSVEVPVSYNDLTKFNAGIAFRIGPVFFGSGSVLSALVRDSRQADLHAGLHLGIPYKKKLRPDTDGDGVFDYKDKCPTVAGLPRYQGCPIPDTDGDGLNDEQDSCVSVKGLVRYHGCPIPDTDKDGINDEEDSCKDEPGPARFHGCPDSDGDGIPDRDDKCPTTVGVAKYGGCPVPDRDKDGINDDEDLCPDQPGPASTKGCPVEQIAVRLTADFKNILFDFGRASIKASSMDIITHAAQTMNQQIPNAAFYIDGYTDNVGSAAKNKRLSQARAKAVADALVNAGVARDRLIARGFGMENPKCENTTDEGRQCNRRVEVVVKK